MYIKVAIGVSFIHQPAIMETTTFVTVLSVALACLLKTAFACVSMIMIDIEEMHTQFLCTNTSCFYFQNGYDFKINSFKNCNPNSVLQFKDVTAVMDKDCNIVPSGCVNIGKTIKTSKVHKVACNFFLFYCESFRGITKLGSHLCRLWKEM